MFYIIAVTLDVVGTVDVVSRSASIITRLVINASALTVSRVSCARTVSKAAASLVINSLPHRAAAARGRGSRGLLPTLGPDCARRTKWAKYISTDTDGGPSQRRFMPDKSMMPNTNQLLHTLR
jgi:type IV secretory pathway protease TraF